MENVPTKLRQSQDGNKMVDLLADLEDTMKAIDDGGKDPYTPEMARVTVDKVLAPELVNMLTQSVNYLQNTSDAVTANDTHFHVKDGIYLRLTVYKDEPALGDQVMKCDHWEGIHQLAQFPSVEGAPNFRRIENTCMFGVGQPTLNGARSVLQSVVDTREYEFVIWINLREEPVTYLNNQPFAPRDPETLNINLEHLIGIEGLDLETMEARMKGDIKESLYLHGNDFKYYFQNKDMRNELFHVKIDPNEVKTPREFFSILTSDKIIDMDYFRIPITDELAPEEKDFDDLIETLQDKPQTAAIVFNCQMGRGRTTTGLVCGYLILYTHSALARKNGSPKKKVVRTPGYANGDYAMIKKLVSHLEDGEAIKQQVDDAIDYCAHFQNLRNAILECKVKVDSGEDVQKFLKRGLNYLERYWWLIVFNAYLNEQAPKYKKKFSNWMKARWGLKRLLRKMELK